MTSHATVGLQPIRVRRIVGTAGKAGKIGSDFLHLGSGPAKKSFSTIRDRMKAGEVLPPIAVYQLGYRYFVIDGHTRVAAAKALGIEFIDAMVTEALPRKEGTPYLTYYARRDFERSTGLQGVRLTAPWRYHLLLRHIQGYQLYLEHSLGRDVSLPEAAGLWHRAQYLPTLVEIWRRAMPSSVGGCTAGDVYTTILEAWTQSDGPAVSFQEMLDRLDKSVRRDQGLVMRARRLVSGLGDTSLLPPIASMIHARPGRFVELDVEANLMCFTARSRPTADIA